MSKSRSPSEFAYGYDEYEDCVCPAVAAGYSPSSGDESIEIAEIYDDEVRTLRHDEYNGVVPEAVAKEAWRRAVDAAARAEMDEQVEIGEEIADSLGWEITNE